MSPRIDAIFDLFASFGDQRYGEDVSQLGHALQCAQLAREDGAGEALVAAALLHDIGQFLDAAGDAAERQGRDARHEEGGAAFLRSAFPEAVTEPIRLHVEAKRYLCAVEPDYAASLSRASSLSLQYQGGPMTGAEQEAFRRHPYWREALQLRRYDDGGKRVGGEPQPLSSYRGLLERLLRQTEASGTPPAVPA